MPEQTKTAVIIEDQPEVRHVLVDVLEAAGFSTVSVGNGLDGVRAVLSYQPLITTLDVNMPGIDGFEAARRIRAQSDTYIIMLTGLDDEADAVLGLSSGADEYIVKPFRPRELRARIDAMLRRARPVPTAPASPAQDAVGPSFPGARAQTSAVRTVTPEPAPAPVYAEPAETTVLVASESPVPSTSTVVAVPEERGDNCLTHRDLVLDPDTHITTIREHEVALTPTEFDLLATLMESKRRVRSKADLTLVLRGESYVTSYFVGEADKRAVEAHMTNLRRKLGDDAVNPRYIETVRGVGYRMTSEQLAAPASLTPGSHADDAAV